MSSFSQPLQCIVWLYPSHIILSAIALLFETVAIAINLMAMAVFAARGLLACDQQKCDEWLQNAYVATLTAVDIGITFCLTAINLPGILSIIAIVAPTMIKPYMASERQITRLLPSMLLIEK